MKRKESRIGEFLNASAPVLRIVPQRCVVCGRYLPGGPPLCDPCRATLTPISGPRCARCGVPLVYEIEVCVRCRQRELSYQTHRSLFAYAGTVKAVIVAYKFNRRRSVASVFVPYLAHRLRTEFPGAVVCPVPASRKGRRRRGFDQVAMLARLLHAQHDVDVRSLLARGRAGEQKKLDFVDRSRNLLGAIELRGGHELPRHVVLLDDVFTTGATINECARVLIGCGVERVDALTLAAD